MDEATYSSQIDVGFRLLAVNCKNSQCSTNLNILQSTDVLLTGPLGFGYNHCSDKKHSYLGTGQIEQTKKFVLN